MKSVDPQRAVIFESSFRSGSGARRRRGQRHRRIAEVAMEIGDPGFAFIKDGAAKKSVPFDIEHHFGQTLGLLEEFVGLETSDRGQCVKRIGFGDGDHIVGNRVDPELALIEILEHERITQLCHIDDAINVFSEIGVIFQRCAIAPGRNRAARQSRSIEQRILVLDIISF